MTNWEHRHLGAKRAPGSLTELEIDHFFTMRRAEKAVVLSRRGADNQVGLALMIGMLRMTGRRQSRGPSAPKAVLEPIGRQIGVVAPEIASLRTLYRREATRAAHEAAARAVMGFKELSAGARSQLVAYLRAECATTHDLAELERRARVWLYIHATVAPPARALEELCRDALSRREAALAADIRAAVGDAQVEAWIDALSERVGDGVTRHEWVRGGPRKKSPSALRDQSEKVRCLLELGAATAALDGLPTTLIAAMRGASNCADRCSSGGSGSRAARSRRPAFSAASSRATPICSPIFSVCA